MDQDEPAPQRRPSTARDRPTRVPFGPRRPKITQDMQGEEEAEPTSHVDAAVQAVSQPSTATATTFTAPPALAHPPHISFESIPIPWKGLPLEAAQWTFSSAELQEIVSKAIRLSARDSFVRLLSLQALEVDIVHESDRLEHARLAAQAKWRFEAGRRTMLVQALNACAANQHPTDAILGFVGQLATAIASCDSLLSTVLQITDQQSQIAIIQHQHWASALGMALRKLNKAHERQGQELKRVQARVQTLEDELEEAWREAEKMAIEFDDLEHEIADSESECIDAPEDAVDSRPDLELKHDLDETGTLGDVTINTDIAVVLGVTATAVASKATLVTSSKPPVDKSDTRSIRSFKSTRSRRSTRDGQSHLARLSSARTRSRAASNASLRLPKALRSTSSSASPVDPPPIPALPSPIDPSMPPLPSPTAQGQSFLDMDNVAHDHVRKAIPPKRGPEPTLALPTPPHSAGLPQTQVPSIWLESDAGDSTRLSILDRSHSLQIFSSLTPRKIRRSNLVMSLTGSDGCGSGASGSGSGSGSISGTGSGPGPGSRLSGTASGDGSSASSVENHTGGGTGSPTSTHLHSPVSLPTRVRGPSLSSSSDGIIAGRGFRPGSAGARLTTTREDEETRAGSGTGLGTHTQRQTEALAPFVGSPRRSLVSRASSVILRRLSQATMGGVAGAGAGAGAGRAPGSGGRTTGGKGAALGSPSRTREASRLSGGGRALVERWRDRGKEGDRDGPGNGADEGEGEVMLIGSPHADVFDAP